MNNKTIHQEQQHEQAELVPQELLIKFDNDPELVQQFLEQGYSIDELRSSTVTHPTKYDPVCTLEDGQQAGIWLYSNNSHHTNRNIGYNNYTWEETVEQRRRS